MTLRYTYLDALRCHRIVEKQGMVNEAIRITTMKRLTSSILIVFRCYDDK